MGDLVPGATSTPPVDLVNLGETLARSLLFSLERRYLDVAFEKARFLQPIASFAPILEPPSFLTLEQVGQTARGTSEDPLTALQTALSACHIPGRYTLVFTIASDGLEQRVFLGARSHDPDTHSSTEFMQHLGCFIEGNWPGTRFAYSPPDSPEISRFIGKPLERKLRYAVALTGIPSLKPDDSPGYPQSLDRLLRGLRGRPFLYMVIADPLPTPIVEEMIYRGRDLVGRVHTLVKATLTDTETQGTSETWGRTDTRTESWTRQTTKSTSVSKSFGFDLSTGVFLGGLGVSMIFPPAALLAGLVAGGLIEFGPQSNYTRQQGTSDTAGYTLATSIADSYTRGLNVSVAQGLGREYLDAHAQAAEAHLQQYLERLEAARSLGCWNVGAYLLADSPEVADQGAIELRALLSGEKSALEPIRTHNLKRIFSAHVQTCLSQFTQPSIALVGAKIKSDDDLPLSETDVLEHPLGRPLSFLTTPLAATELALLVNLPRREVPGVRVMPSADFSLNPPPATASSLVLGQLLEGGQPTSLSYAMPPEMLAKHTLVTGITGSGKSTTCRRLLNELHHRNIPFLVIEPAKDEYVAWAMAVNASRSAGVPPIAVYMPGAVDWRGHKLDGPLSLNPLDIVRLEGQAPQVLGHIDRLKSIFNAAFPMADVLPVMMEDLIYFTYEKVRGWLNDPPPSSDTPAPQLRDMYNLIGSAIAGKGYEQRIKDNLRAALETRVGGLRRGWKKDLFDQARSTAWKEIFDTPAVINLSCLGDDADKAFTMALLVMFLHEYRVVVGADPASQGLRHLLVLEEAHRIMPRVSATTVEMANPQAKTAEMFSNILSEIRSYGQGILVVDQVPARLVADAIKNTNLKIVHRLVAEDDQQAMAGCMNLSPEQRAIINRLRPGQAIVYGDQDDVASWIYVPWERTAA